MLTVEQLNAIRERVRQELLVRHPQARLLVGLGTPGIAAGARDVMMAALDELSKQTSGMIVSGADLHVEADKHPAVKFVSAEKEELFTNVTPEMVRDLVRKLGKECGLAADS